MLSQLKVALVVRRTEAEYPFLLELVQVQLPPVETSASNPLQFQMKMSIVVAWPSAAVNQMTVTVDPSL